MGRSGPVSGPCGRSTSGAFHVTAPILPCRSPPADPPLLADALYCTRDALRRGSRPVARLIRRRPMTGPAGPAARAWLDLAAIESGVMDLRPDYTALITV